MVKIEHAAEGGAGQTAAARLPEVRFQNPRLAALGIEPMTLAQLRRRAPAKHLTQPQRVDFFMLMLVTAGRGRHTVDFVDWPVAAGSLLLVRPGQVQQWHLEDEVEARLVLIDPSALPHWGGPAQPRELELLALDEWPGCAALDADSARATEAALGQLWSDFEAFDGQELDISLIRHGLMALLLRIARQLRHPAAAGEPRPVDRRIYRLFLQALEADFPRRHGLQYYATRLGYAANTLARACREAEGRSAKQVIDRRIALEAQRLLAHSIASVAEIAHQLGFSESTNFVKFFRRQVGATPSEFRRKATRR